MGTKRKTLLIEIDTPIPNKQLTGADSIFLLSLGDRVILDTKIIQVNVNIAKRKGGRTDAEKK